MTSVRSSSLEQACLEAIDDLAVPRSGDDLLLLPATQAGRAFANPERVLTHVPAYPEVVFARQGRLPIVCPGGPVTLAAGQVLMIEPGVEHGEDWARGTDFDIVFLGPIHSTNVQLYRRQPGHEWSLYLIGRTDLAYVVEPLRAELAEREVRFESSVHGLLEHLAAIAARRVRRGSYLRLPCLDMPDAVGVPGWSAINRTLGHLAAHLREEVDLEQVARSVGYSLGHLNRIFARQFGKTVSHCLRELRMTQARDLLRHTNLSLAEIGDRVGYGDPSNFRRAFVSATGLHPKDLRAGLGWAESGGYERNPHD
jgi:AraC-like DNA-binding protein